MKITHILFLFIALLNVGITNSPSNDFTKESLKIFYDNDAEGTESSNVKGKEMSILFNCCFDDSVVVYLNDDVVYRKRLKTDPVLSFSGATRVSFDNSIDSNMLRVELPAAKVYSEISLDKNYKLLYLSRSEAHGKRYGHIWTAQFRNVPIDYE